MKEKNLKTGSAGHGNLNRVTPALMLIAIGVVYGDIGTSPMYVMKSIVEGNGGIGCIDRDFIIGAFSLVIWTITLLTTVQFVFIAMKADNHGEGGIFALFSLVRKCGKALIIPAMVGGAAMLADGILTPAVTVTTAVEGLRSISVFGRLLEKQTPVVIITLLIIAGLFSVQRAGTSAIGKAFGPVMLVWFLFLGVTGVWRMSSDLSVWAALNPVYAIRVLISPNNKVGFMILGSVFLSTTGAEALYSDMGHVGRNNVYASWPFVKLCLLLNYGGQCAWIISHQGDPVLMAMEDMNPFYLMLPEMLRPVAVVLSAMAAIIASQALITGSFTLVSEAIRLDLLPHMQVRYPAETKGQLYISLVNTITWVGCSLMVLYFRSGSRIEAAYGLSITVAMLMTTLLLVSYLIQLKKKLLLGLFTGIVFGAIEVVFFISSLGKFVAGGYVAALLALFIFVIMIIWYRASQLENSQRIDLNTRDYIEKLRALKEDESIPLRAENVVYITRISDPELMERDILYSILDKDPKRAVTYWFLHVNVIDEPFEASYQVETFGTDFIFFVTFNLGFKTDQRLNMYLRQVVADLMASGELPPQEKRHSIYGPSRVGSFKFGVIHKVLSNESEISSLDNMILSAKYAIRDLIGSPNIWYGLETSSQMLEYVPLFIHSKAPTHLERLG